MTEKNKKTKNQIIATIFDGLVVLSAVFIAGKGVVSNNIQEIYVWGLIPLAFLILGSLYKLPAIGATIITIIKVLDVGGMPLLGLLILALLFGFYIYSKETKILEVVKYFVGFVAGAFAQKKRVKTS